MVHTLWSGIRHNYRQFVNARQHVAQVHDGFFTGPADGPFRILASQPLLFGLGLD